MKTGYAFLLAALLSGCAAQTPSAGKPLPPTLYDYSIRSPQGNPLTEQQLADALSQADIVLIGEWHSHPGTHLMQTRLLAALYAIQPNLALSMEQFTRDNQALLDQYLQGDIGEQVLIKQGNAWPNYESDYRPLVEFARLNQLDVIAANAPKSIVRCVGRYGADYLNRLPATERQWVAQSLTLENDPYKEKFTQSMHHGDEAQTERQFAAQTSWDDTMAESMVNYLQTHPGHQILHVAGRFHTAEGLGTASRILARNPALNVVMVTPVTKDSPLSAGAPDYQVEVQPLPPRYVQEANMKAAFAQMGQRNSQLQCLGDSQ
ncbi:ChaN family lipoprotein [Photobacterium sp. GJ3]|uniref:ChaN family lipoprotein n=1 Tax=Photobacterium sp. GJ3 TaxID=2829502 RepID=UPI001B8C67A8|nr:ChaN family lipoprotein [Photobacterium sp. GJ3]QUJ68170.1 ChaN family lipoprotein [Photobacterium sp. GJ3]